MAEIEANIPFRKHVEQLNTGSPVISVRGESVVVASEPGEAGKSHLWHDLVSIIQCSQRQHRFAVNLVQLDADAEISTFRNTASGTKRDVTGFAPSIRRVRQAHIQYL